MAGSSGYPDATHHVEQGLTAVLEEDCDILIPAALEGVINMSTMPIGSRRR